MKATEKQIRYALALLADAGYSTRFMDSNFKKLGAKMAERRGTVEGWLRQMDRSRISELIDYLKGQALQTPSGGFGRP